MPYKSLLTNYQQPQRKIAAVKCRAVPTIDVGSHGLLIWGDNLIGMRKLLDKYEGSIDLVYIDPPYNTHNDFKFSWDRTAHISNALSSQLAYSDKMNHADYLAFMYERLAVIHTLLSKCGTIYLHIDVKMSAYFRIILDEVFGIENFVNEITRVKSNPKNFSRKAFGNQKDTILIYSKFPESNIFLDFREQLSPRNIEQKFPKIDELGRRYTTVPCHAPGQTKFGATGAPWRGILPPPGRHWRCSPEKLEELDHDGMIEWSANGVPRIKRYASEHKGNKFQDIWLEYKDPPFPIYPTEKNMAMLEMIVRQSSNPGSLIMDSFCGSGSFLAAGLRHGRRVIGMDESEVAIAVAMQREELQEIKLITI